jgi:predicted amidophosphoribosyltransferase
MRCLPNTEPVPGAVAPACLVCCGPTRNGFAHCFACRTVAHLLNLPLSPVLPVHQCPVPGPLYRVLMGYKESPVDEVRAHFSRRVGELFATFFDCHLACATAVMGGPVDLVLPVPSSSRPGRASLERAEGLAEIAVSALAPAARWVPSALQRAAGEIGHMRPNASAFAVPPSLRPAVHGARAVLLDDLYVSGSRAQSAAAALRLSGAREVLIVPLGRVLRPEKLSSHAAFAGSGTGAGHPARCLVGQTGAGKE